MTRPSSIPAVFAYLPVIGWVYVLVSQRQNSAAMYHLRQSIGLVLFLAAVTAGWMVVGWVLAWIPYLFVASMALFAIVITAYVYGLVVWLMGISNALRTRLMPLPLFGHWASRLPIG